MIGLKSHEKLCSDALSSSLLYKLCIYDILSVYDKHPVSIGTYLRSNNMNLNGMDFL